MAALHIWAAGVLPAAAHGDLCGPAGRSEGCCDDDEESAIFSLCSASPDSVAPPQDPTAAGSESASVVLTHSVREDKKDGQETSVQTFTTLNSKPYSFIRYECYARSNF